MFMDSYAEIDPKDPYDVVAAVVIGIIGFLSLSLGLSLTLAL